MINVKSDQAVEVMATEVLFNSVEIELARRWAHGEVPAMFAGRPVDHLRKMVKAWWQIYHESAAAATGRNRTVWERSQSSPAEALGTPALVSSLATIRESLNLDALKGFRPLFQAEHSAITILDIIINYYTKLNN